MAEGRKNRNSHLSDIKLDDSGDYNYQGDFYALEYDGAHQAFIMRLWPLTIIALLAEIIAGLFPATGASDTWYVILSFGITISLVLVIIYHLFKLTASLLSKDPSKIYSSKDSGESNSSESHSSKVLSKEDSFKKNNGVGLVREYIYQKTWPRLIPLTKGMAITSALTLILEVLHLMLKGKGNHFGGAVLFLICTVITSAISLALLHCYNGIKWRKIAKRSD